MFDTLLQRIKALFVRKKAKKTRKPLVSSAHDHRLLQRMRGRKVPSRRQLRHLTKFLSATEKRLIQISVVLLVAGVVWGGIVFVNQFRDRVPAVGGKYVEAVVGEPELINPIYASLNDVDMDIVSLVYSGLMRFDKNQELVPDLAETYEISDDRLTYTFTLRDDAYWHTPEDEEPRKVTARDVSYTFDTIQNEEIESPLFVAFQGVQISSLDDRTIQFTLSEPFAPFLSSLTVGILPEHVWGAIPAERMRLAQTNLRPIGSGPYQFKQLTKDDTGYISRYELERNELYYNETAYIEDIVFDFFATYDGDVGAIQALRQQSVDGIHFVPSDLRDKAVRKHITLNTLRLPQYTALFFNQEQQPVLEDIDVRSALEQALDKERILSETLDNEGDIIYSPILPGFPGFSEDVTTTDYSISEANALLDEEWTRISVEEYRGILEKERLADWLELNGIATSTLEDDNVTSSEKELLQQEIDTAKIQIQEAIDAELPETQTFYRQNDDGDILSMSLVTADTPEYRQASQLIAGYWQEIGVRTTISIVPVKDFTRDTLRYRSYDVLLYGYIIGSDPDQYPFWHSSQIDHPGLNLSQYVNRDVDALLEEARTATSTEAIAAAYTQVQASILEDKPAIFLYSPTYTYATTDKVKGIDIDRIFRPSNRFTNVTEWYIETKGKWKKK